LLAPFSRFPTHSLLAFLPGTTLVPFQLILPNEMKVRLLPARPDQSALCGRSGGLE